MSEHHTVAELIKKLKEFPPDAYVMLQGCDCSNTWDGTVKNEPGWPAGLRIAYLGADV